MKSRKVCNKTRSPPASLVFKGQGTEYTAVKWPVLPLTNLCMALYYVHIAILNKKLPQRTKQNNEKFNKAMQKFVGVLDKYARVCNLSLGR